LVSDFARQDAGFALAA